ncbi:MAG: TlpA disulfide reductase family protein [Prolixibacteraceae bacterium]|jgi:peroxiredoxin
MNKTFTVIIAFAIISKVSVLGASPSDKAILKETISKLNSIKTVEYLVVFSFSRKDVGQHSTDSAICFFDFESKDNVLGTKYHFKSSAGEQIYNGHKEIRVDYNEGKVIYRENPSKVSVASSIFMMNSIFEIKEVLPELVRKSNVQISRQKDTLVNNEWNYKFRICIKGGQIFQGKIQEISMTNVTWEYTLAISKESYLPTYFCSYFIQNKGQQSSTFSNFDFSTERLDDIWNYDQYEKEYVVQSFDEQRKERSSTGMVKVGDMVPGWKLPIVNSQDSLKITDLKGNLVLIEFFFPGCGACVKAIPDMNNLYKSYQDKGLKVYGIEFSKSNDKGLHDYLKKYDYLHPVLHTGGEVAKRYGVNSAPTYFLIDKNGKVVYKSIGFKNIDEIIKVVEENM